MAGTILLCDKLALNVAFTNWPRSLAQTRSRTYLDPQATRDPARTWMRVGAFGHSCNAPVSRAPSMPCPMSSAACCRHRPKYCHPRLRVSHGVDDGLVLGPASLAFTRARGVACAGVVLACVERARRRDCTAIQCLRRRQQTTAGRSAAQGHRSVHDGALGARTLRERQHFGPSAASALRRLSARGSAPSRSATRRALRSE